MTYLDQRKFALKKFPKVLHEVIRDEDFCYSEICSKIKELDLVDVCREIVFKSGVSEWACYWAREIGDQDIMRDRVTDPGWAYLWAREIGDQDIMRDRVTDPGWAYRWALDIGDQDIMRDRITGSEWAYLWALDIGDRDIMRDRITDPNWERQWEKYIEKRRKG